MAHQKISVLPSGLEIDFVVEEPTVLRAGVLDICYKVLPREFELVEYDAKRFRRSNLQDSPRAFEILISIRRVVRVCGASVYVVVAK